MAGRVTGFTSQTAEETLAVEEPLEIQLGYGTAEGRAVKSISVTMRTPGYDFELAAGFLMTEGVVRDVNDIERIAYAGTGNIGISAQQSATGSYPCRIERIEMPPVATIPEGCISRRKSVSVTLFRRSSRSSYWAPKRG